MAWVMHISRHHQGRHHECKARLNPGWRRCITPPQGGFAAKTVAAGVTFSTHRGVAGAARDGVHRALHQHLVQQPRHASRGKRRSRLPPACMQIEAVRIPACPQPQAATAHHSARLPDHDTSQMYQRATSGFSTCHTAKVALPIAGPQYGYMKALDGILEMWHLSRQRWRCRLRRAQLWPSSTCPSACHNPACPWHVAPPPGPVTHECDQLTHAATNIGRLEKEGNRRCLKGGNIHDHTVSLRGPVWCVRGCIRSCGHVELNHSSPCRLHALLKCTRSARYKRTFQSTLVGRTLVRMTLELPLPYTTDPSGTGVR